MFVGCTEDSYNDGISFYADIDDIKAYSASVTVTHNATNSDTYYVFAVKGIVSDVRQEIDRFISESNPAQLEYHAHNQRKSKFYINRLSPNTSFTLIVFGMNNDGTQYGEPFSVVFSTTEAEITSQVNDNWKVSYYGHAVYNNHDYSKIIVNVSGEIEERYFIAIYPIDEVKTFDDMESFLVHATDVFLESVRNQEQSVFWLENEFILKDDIIYYENLKIGDYLAYAIGINADGSPTGHYARTKIFHVDKYPMTEGYSSLLGMWTLSDSTNKTYYFLILEDVVNETVEIEGWGNFGYYSIYAYYDRKDNSLRIPPQIVEKETEMTFTDGSTFKGELSLRGAYYNSDKKLKYTTAVSPLTIGKLKKDGNYIFNCNFLNAIGGNVSEKDSGLSFYIKRDGESNVGFARMMFPFVMERYEE